MSKKTQQKEKKFLNGNYALLPIIFVLCIVPFIMRLYVYDSGLEQFPWFPNRKEEIDIFLYYRSVAVVAAGVIMAGLLAYCVYKEWKKSKQKNLAGFLSGTRFKGASWVVPLKIFALMALLSTLFSEYRSYGFSGIYEQFESIWVVLAYGIIAFYTYYFVKTKADMDVIQKALFVILAVLGFIGITQFTGHDFWETGLGKSFFVPSSMAAYKDNLSFNFSGSGNHQVYLTFYNPNYVGVFAALILPVSIMLCVGNKGWQKKLAWGILSIVIFLCALGCGSRAFLLSLAATAFIGLILYIRKRAKHLPVILAGGVVLAGIVVAYMNYANVDMIQYVKSALTPVENKYAVSDFVIHEDNVELVYNGNSIFMEYEVAADGAPYFAAKDAAGTEIPFTTDENAVMYLNDERFSGVSVKFFGGYDEYTYVAEVYAAGHRYAFSIGNEGYTYMNYAYRPDQIVKADAALFTKYDTFVGNRGYLWSRSIPLLKDNIILGTGADTFPVVFPHNDYVAKINAGYQDQLVTKPHSLYLQMGIQYGVVALLCYLVMMAMYVVQSIVICWKADFRNLYSCCALGIFLGILGYGIMGISNDSCVALAPMAWLLLGVGFAVNKIVKEDM